MIYCDNWIEQPFILSKPITKGALVKISNGVEIFYVDVILTKPNFEYIGCVSNILINERSYKVNDMVSFRYRHAIEILTSEERSLQFDTITPLIKYIFMKYITEYVNQHNRMPTEQESLDYFERNINTREI